MNAPVASREPVSVRILVGRAATDLWRVLPQVLLFQLVFAVLGIGLLSPLLAWMFNRLAATTGNSAIGNLDIAWFLLTPIGGALGLSAQLRELIVGGVFLGFEAREVRRRRTLVHGLLEAGDLAAQRIDFAGTRAGFLARLFIAPYYVNYHLEHHLLFYVPCYNLPRVHRMLGGSRFAGRMEVQPSYAAVLRLATAKPDQEDRPGQLVNSARRARAGARVGADQTAGGF